MSTTGPSGTLVSAGSRRTVAPTHAPSVIARPMR